MEVRREVEVKKKGKDEKESLRWRKACRHQRKTTTSLRREDWREGRGSEEEMERGKMGRYEDDKKVEGTGGMTKSEERIANTEERPSLKSRGPRNDEGSKISLGHETLAVCHLASRGSREWSGGVLGEAKLSESVINEELAVIQAM